MSTVKDYKNASWDDIVFDNQNKDYGAYVLRQLVHKNTLRGFLYAMAGFLLLMLLLRLGVLTQSNKKEKVVDLEMTDVQIEDVPPPVEALPPPPPPPPPPPQRPTVKFVEMIAKKDAEVAEEEPITKVEETKEVAISTVTQEGDKDAKAIVTDEKPGNGPVAAPEPEAPKEPEIFDRAEVMPGYPGGPVEMMKFLSKNIKYPSLARENNLEGKVIIKFYVDTDGSVKDPKVLKDGVGGGCADEAVRVVNSMPKWTPGTQRGKKVKVYYILPVTFKLAN
ncbi:MAG: TonB family protein [Chitinophagales bacterium]|nr:TonB family protein [Bacteroidota bacterium]